MPADFMDHLQLSLDLANNKNQKMDAFRACEAAIEDEVQRQKDLQQKIEALHLQIECSRRREQTLRTRRPLLQQLQVGRHNNPPVEIIISSPKIEDINCPYVEGCLGLIEPLEDKKDDVCYTKKQEGEGTEPAENLVERRPSCLDSDISSNIPSPQESDNNYFQ